MTMKYLNILFILSMLSLSACNFSKPLEWVYYDRVKFTFVSEDEDSDYVYLCTKEATEQETKEKANKANKYFTQQIKKVAEEFADSLMEQVSFSDDEENDFSLMDSIKAGLKLQKQTEKISADVEKQFKCLMIDSIERE